MNSRRAIELVLVVTLSAAAIWWWTHAVSKPASKPKPVATAPAPIRATSPTVSRPAPAVATPEATPTAPAPETPAVVAAEPPTVTPVAYDSQAELGSTITGMIRLLQNSDYMVFIETYAPPDMLAEMSADDKADMTKMIAQQDPEMKQQLQTAIAELQSIQSTTPVYDATGNTATYTPTVDVNGSTSGTPHRITFVKVNGRWYAKNL